MLTVDAAAMLMSFSNGCGRNHTLRHSHEKGAISGGTVRGGGVVRIFFIFVGTYIVGYYTSVAVISVSTTPPATRISLQE